MAMVVKRMAMVVKVSGWRDISMVKNNTALVEDQTTTSYNSSSRRSGKFSWTPWTPATHTRT